MKYKTIRNINKYIPRLIKLDSVDFCNESYTSASSSMSIDVSALNVVFMNSLNFFLNNKTLTMLNMIISKEVMPKAKKIVPKKDPLYNQMNTPKDKFSINNAHDIDNAMRKYFM
jgi:hypothetical protein